MHLGRGICYIINDDTVVGEREIESLPLFIFPFNGKLNDVFLVINGQKAIKIS